MTNTKTKYKGSFEWEATNSEIVELQKIFLKKGIKYHIEVKE